jgi:hypothetical protein
VKLGPGPPRRAARLPQAQRLSVHVVGLGLWLSGALWLLFHHFVRRRGEFGWGPHPLEPWWLTLHGAFGFAAIWLLGLLWGVHVTAGWRTRRRRWSGALLAGVLVLLALSGYLLYYLGNERARAVVSVLHWAVGLACPGAFLAHRLRDLLRRRARRAVRVA